MMDHMFDGCGVQLEQLRDLRFAQVVRCRAQSAAHQIRERVGERRQVAEDRHHCDSVQLTLVVKLATQILVHLVRNHRFAAASDAMHEEQRFGRSVPDPCPGHRPDIVSIFASELNIERAVVDIDFDQFSRLVYRFGPASLLLPSLIWNAQMGNCGASNR